MASVSSVSSAAQCLPFQKLLGGRRTQFDTLEKPALRAAAAERYELQSQAVRANVDYHSQSSKNMYSVPHHLVNEQIEARLTIAMVELLYKGRCAASHVRR